MRRTALVVGCVSLAFALIGCSHHDDQPVVDLPSTPPPASGPLPTPRAGIDAIGGSVSNNLADAPHIVLPHVKPSARLLTKDIVQGSGQVAGPESTVTVRYVGLTYNGKRFHSSWSTGGPESFSLVGYVVGFADGVSGMRVGGRREIVVPPTLAYGSGRYGAVGPNETLVFVVDLLKVS
jgi:peptidylprolyl isomerase